MGANGISVVVPTLNEAPRISSFLTHLRQGRPREVIVVDGGSDDETPRLAATLADRVLEASGGLAQQINRGAGEATASTLFFPYVDTELPPSWPHDIRRELADPRVVAGAFRLALSSRKRRYRFIAGGANLRTSLRLGPLGDQAIFARREAFDAVGGYRDTSLLEDLDFIRRLRRLGRVAIAPQAVTSSVRRWEENGIIATSLRNWGFLASHLLGWTGRRQRVSYQHYRSRTR